MSGNEIGQFESQGAEAVINRKLTSEKRDWAKLWGMKVGLQMAHRNRAGAIDLVNTGLDELESREEQGGLLATHISEIMPTRLANAVEQGCGVTNISKLLETEINELISMPGFDTRSVIEVYRGLAAFAVKKLLALESRMKVMENRSD